MGIKSPPPPYRIEVNAALPEKAKAVSIALAILRCADVSQWSELSRLPSGVVVSDEQYELLHRHAEVLPFIRWSVKPTPGETKPPTATIAVCPECGEWVLLTRGTAPARCEMTARCAGKPVKAIVAKKGAVVKQAVAVPA